MMTQDQLAAAIRNMKRDAAFWADADKVAKHEREATAYEEFCKRFGHPY